jgi:hypothetical protein
METRISGLLAGLVLGGSYLVGCSAIAATALYYASRLQVRLAAIAIPAALAERRS